MAARQGLTKAVNVGKEMAAATLERRAKATRRRARALAAVRVEAAPAGPIARAAVARVSAGAIVAEGDSWFDYPFIDILSELEDSYGFDVEKVAHRGDSVEDMAYSDGQLDDFSRQVEKVLRSGVEPRAILLSGGGNDVAGDEFAIMINHATSSAPGLNEFVVAGIVDERVRNAYATILSAITEVCKAQVGHPVPIVVHGYDYPVPDGRGFFGGFGPFPGPWLDPGFRRKGYADMNVRKQICVALIDRFNAMLAGLARTPPFAHVRFLDLRNTLATGANYKRFWDNEMHPTRKGFADITAKFAAVV